MASLILFNFFFRFWNWNSNENLSLGFRVRKFRDCSPLIFYMILSSFDFKSKIFNLDLENLSWTLKLLLLLAKVLNFKAHQICTGAQKNIIYLRRGKYPPKVLFFSVTVQVWCALKFNFFVFVVPVQVRSALKFQILIFLSLCRFGALGNSKFGIFLFLCMLRALWNSKSDILLYLYHYIMILYIFLFFSDYCAFTYFFNFHKIFKDSGALFVQIFPNSKINLFLFRARF